MRLAFLLAAVLSICGVPARGATILDVSGPDPFGFGSQRAFATGWHQTTTFTNVSISMPLSDNTAGGPIGGVQGVVFLMNQIGPGTTATNEVTPPVSISGLLGSFNTISLFSGLTLGPGDYFIVLAPTNAGDGAESFSPEGSSSSVAVLGIGVTQLNGGVPNLVAAFVPATDFLVTGPEASPANIFITVTGDTDAEAVPEPATIWSSVAGIAAVVCWKRRRQRLQRA